ncbi:MAG: GDSL-type esterase/lipase family protein [candidate division Zixibacteria bacterium]|nr:GDSL-type esterase/lipase family protein [candidate division Zixibacteria bacterium]
MADLTPRKKILFSILLVFFSLSVAELFFRLLPEPPRPPSFRLIYNPEMDFPKFYLKDKNLFWRLRPNQNIKSDFVVAGSYRTNSGGFRDREFSENRPSSKRRILCLGNSITFGWQVAEERAYPQVLQKLLPDRYEVYNCAQTGYTTFQGKRLLNELLQKYRPQVVSVAYIWNDLLPAANGVADSEQKMPPQRVLALQNFLARLAACRWGRYFSLRIFSSPAKTSGLPRVPQKEYRANFEEMLERSRSHDIQPILILPPAPKPEWMGGQEKRYRESFYEPFRTYAAEIRKLASVHHIPLVDADSALSGELSVWQNLPDDFIHPSAAAHQKIAGMLAAILSEQEEFSGGP